MIDPGIIQVITALLKALSFIILYFIIGFGPGIVIGMLLANRYVGRDHPLKMDTHQENVQKAAEHQAQWHPDNTRWQ